MSLVRVDNQTGKLSGGGLSASVGVGGTFDLGQLWSGPTVGSPDWVKLIVEPPMAGSPSARFEAVLATVVNGNATATVVERQADGTSLFDHPNGVIWACGPTSRDFVADATRIWNQSSPASVWHVVHNLNSYPSVTIVSSAGDELEADIQYVSANQVDITFDAANGGFAYLN